MRALRFSIRARRARGDDGVTLILFALVISALLIVVAIVIDFSVVRDTRQSNKSVADVTVAAGMRGLASADGVPKPWAGVCKAIDYFRLNHPDGSSLSGVFRDGSGATVSSPCTTTSALYASFCSADDDTTWAWYDGEADGGRIEVDIKSGYATPDADFPEDTAAYAGDDNTTPLGACGQLAVIIGEVDPAYFGGAAGSSEYASVIRSVGRVTVGEQNPLPVALLLLEKTACRALHTEGNNTFVLVRANAATNRPGLIQVNSTGEDCSGGSRVIEGSSVCPALTSCVGGGPSIVAEDAATVRGVVGNHALGGAFASFANTSACDSPGAPSAGCTLGPIPLDRGVVSRSSVDNRYLTRVTALKATANSAIANADASASYYQVPNNSACSNLRDKTISATLPDSATVINTGGLSRVYIGCNFDTGSNQTTRFDETITDVVARGTMDVGSNGTLRLDGVRRFYVGGATGGSANGMNIQGTLWVNGGSVPDDCATRRASAPSLVTEMVISNGRLSGGAAAVIHLCNTFVFLADGNLPTTAGTDAADRNYNGGISFGAQTRLDWSAPNQTEALVPSADPVYDQFEDLALWTESGNCANTNAPPTNIGGQGSVVATGVFFLPNACFNLSGGGFGASIGADAQFIVRRLTASGTTQLSMAPNPANVVPIPFFESFRLVR